MATFYVYICSFPVAINVRNKRVRPRFEKFSSKYISAPVFNSLDEANEYCLEEVYKKKLD